MVSVNLAATSSDRITVSRFGFQTLVRGGGDLEFPVYSRESTKLS